MSNQRIRLFVTGRVQGVFFRQTLKTRAIQNDVFGWVKNLKDGRVEAILEGNEENVSRLVEWAHAGPANAIVEDVEIRNEKFTDEFSKFDVLY
ncbi:acylphosphatase [Nitrosopumilus sp.]|uniref:acylphosphatase n=1 Tax=Nitrosopumilus sp. TaxID=2024843 RepID=UPI003D10FF47